ncbi:hypothetical protein RFI_13921 [Reticulomyxa filosa]|uniref:VWFA domain-containing protein n=1 Tax=Reticulomyxa filosa TaxID=46433 RepID=X6ND53_RETFI|nr:hypothetical protein RFI_13921 [Reticulomyxa filosa]|eukprot:ETO23262.1 hypothetical protein RFI_13921 [Reticulomyxa filosa]
MYIIDDSCGAQMNAPKCHRLKQHLIDLAFHFDVGNDLHENTRIGIVTFTHHPKSQLALSKGTNMHAIINAIEQIDCTQTDTSKNLGLEYAFFFNKNFFCFVPLGKKTTVEAVKNAAASLNNNYRYLSNGDLFKVNQVVIVYPLCDCSMNRTLCSGQNDNADEIKRQLSNKQVIIYVSGHMTDAQDYSCLVSQSSSDDHLFNNPTCDTLPYIFDGQTLALSTCKG